MPPNPDFCFFGPAVNHAYIGLTDYHIKDMPLAEWQKTINVNLTGTVLSISARATN